VLVEVSIEGETVTERMEVVLSPPPCEAHRRLDDADFPGRYPSNGQRTRSCLMGVFRLISYSTYFWVRASAWRVLDVAQDSDGDGRH
jgi:hypothetical protein